VPSSHAHRTFRFPYFPSRFTACVQFVELLLVFERVQACPETVIFVGTQGLFLNKPSKRLTHEFFALAYVVKDRAGKHEITPVDPNIRMADIDDVGNVRVVADLDDMEALCGPDGQEEPDGIVGVEIIDQVGKWQVSKAIAVIGEKDLFAVEIGLNRHKPLPNVRRGARVDKSDTPVIDIRVFQVELLTAVREGKVVGKTLIIVEEVVLDHVRLVAEANDKVLVAEVGVVFHEMPQDGSVANVDHGLGDRVRVFPEPNAEPSAEQDNFHIGSPSFLSADVADRCASITWLQAASSGIHRDARNRNHESAAPVANKAYLTHNFIFEIPGQDQQIVRLGRSDLIGVEDGYMRSR